MSLPCLMNLSAEFRFAREPVVAAKEIYLVKGRGICFINFVFDCIRLLGL
jgi:hypothetical protein